MSLGIPVPQIILVRSEYSFGTPLCIIQEKWGTFQAPARVNHKDAPAGRLNI